MTAGWLVPVKCHRSSSLLLVKEKKQSKPTTMEASDIRRPTQSATCWRLSKEERLRFDAPGKNKKQNKTRRTHRPRRASNTQEPTEYLHQACPSETASEYPVCTAISGAGSGASSLNIGLVKNRARRHKGKLQGG